MGDAQEAPMEERLRPAGIAEFLRLLLRIEM
jgi:hypothetical protein